MSHDIHSKIKESIPAVLGGLAVLLGAWLIYEQGLAVGLRQLASYAYLLVLFYLSIATVMTLMLRQSLFGKREYLLAPLVLAYFAVSFVLGWPALFFLTFAGLVCGAIVGTVSAFTSPYRR